MAGKATGYSQKPPRVYRAERYYYYYYDYFYHDYYYYYHYYYYYYYYDCYLDSTLHIFRKDVESLPVATAAQTPLPRGSYPAPLLATYFSIHQILTKELGTLKKG